MTTLTFQGETFKIGEYQTLQSPSDYVKTQLGFIVQHFKLHTIYDSQTGYAVGTLNIGEIRVMLNEMWWSELEPELAETLASKPFLETVDFVDVIDSGMMQLKIRMLATMRPTPALAFQRDKLALERMRQSDPNRIASYLLIRLLIDNGFQRSNTSGLNDILTRHESAIAMGRLVKGATDSAALAKLNRQMIELDARFDMGKVRFTPNQQMDLRGFLGRFLDAGPINAELDVIFTGLARFVQQAIAACERAEMVEMGNAAMRPAFVEKTHEEVMAGIYAESARIELERSHKAKRREESKGKIKVGKITLNGLNINALLGLMGKKNDEPESST